jgi:transcriptional regulator with XRE-family HTH domain
MERRMVGLSIRIMAKTTIYLGQWLIALGRTQAEVHRATGINEGYLSEIVSGKKGNPGLEKLQLIADFLNIPVGSLFKKPPSPEVLQNLSPAHIEALGTLMERFGLQDSPSKPKDPKSRR